jgi:hypothetical protein
MANRCVIRVAAIAVLLLCGACFCSADDCDAIRSRINALKAKLAQAEKDADLVNDPQHPQKEAAARSKALAVARELQDAKDDLRLCEHPTPPPIAGTTKTKLAGMPDPQIAVGRELVAAVDSSDVHFYNKSDLTAVPANDVGRVKNLFASLQQVLNSTIHNEPRIGPLCDPAHPLPVLDNQGHIVKASTCVEEFYDTRIYYDQERGKFWILAGARNRLWPCTTKDGKDGATLGYDRDPDPQDPTTGRCRPVLAGMARRFNALAVTKRGEDLSKGFFTYIVMHDYGDWPQFTVHDGYVVINHRGSHITEVFDAEELAGGTKNESIFGVQPLISIDEATLDPKPNKQVVLVNMRGRSARVTYLLSRHGDDLVVYGLSAPDGSPSGKPTIMKSATVPVKRPMGDGARSNAVYQNGKIYFAYHTCTASTGSGKKKQCTDYTMDVLRMRVVRDGSSNNLIFDSSAAGDFADFQLAGGPVSAAVPAVEVTENNDIVTVFSRGFLTQGKPMGASYAVIYHDLNAVSASAVLQDPVGSQTAGDPGVGGVVDLGSMALDPDPDPSEGNKRVKIWMSHAYSDQGKYTHVIGAMKP